MKKEHFVSLKTKLSIGVIIMCLLIGLLAIFAVTRIATAIIDREYTDRAEQITEAVVTTLDPKDVLEMRDAVLDVYKDVEDKVVPSTEWGSDEWNEYMAHYASLRELPVYHKLQEHFRKYQDIYKVDCIYVTCYKKENRHALYVIDGAYGEDECPPGCVDSFENGIWPDDGEIVPATITNEDVYGWLATAAYPIKCGDDWIGHLCVDISMNEIKAKEQRYVITIAIAMFGVMLVMLGLSLWYVIRNVTKPILTLSDTAKNYCSENNDVVHHDFEKLSINTHDEISQLLSSVKQMETDMNTNINMLIDTKVALQKTEEQAQSLKELAVKDALTGIRNKTAYDYEAEKLEKDLADGFNEFGLAMVDLNFLKRTNDTYGHEKGNISIRRLCMLVCEVFEHSPVFRVGGDEFIVVLKNRDYRNVDALIDDFNNRLEQVQADDTLQPWEQISAAIGYYKFDKKIDKTVDDVFKKADKAMYERKVAMKAERKE